MIAWFWTSWLAAFEGTFNFIFISEQLSMFGSKYKHLKSKGKVTTLGVPVGKIVSERHRKHAKTIITPFLRVNYSEVRHYCHCLHDLDDRGKLKSVLWWTLNIYLRCLRCFIIHRSCFFSERISIDTLARASSISLIFLSLSAFSLAFDI